MAYNVTFIIVYGSFVVCVMPCQSCILPTYHGCVMLSYAFSSSSIRGILMSIEEVLYLEIFDQGIYRAAPCFLDILMQKIVTQ